MPNVFSALALIGALSKLELEFGNVGFCGAGKIGVPGEEPLGTEKRTKRVLSSNPNCFLTAFHRIQSAVLNYFNSSLIQNKIH